MRTALRILGWLASIVLVLVLAGLVFAWVAYPKSEPPPEIRVAGTPDQVERGRYLFHNVAGCVLCHALHDRSLVGDPVVPRGLGQANFQEWGADLFPPNLTPAALREWSDGEIVRAISSGIRHDGSALFPAMPYNEYGHLSREDLGALVAYLRTLEPLPVEHPRGDLDFPLSLIARISARPARSPERTPSPAAGLVYGEYLVTVAGCSFCHTPFGGTPPRPDPALRLAGRHEWTDFPGWIVRSANITPDSATGIGSWTRERFIGRFRQAAVDPASRRPKGEGPSSPMPWADFARMHEEDLGAIYDYLRTVPPIRHEVVRSERAPAE